MPTLFPLLLRRINFPPGSTSTISTSPLALAIVSKSDGGENDNSDLLLRLKAWVGVQSDGVPFCEADDDPEASIILGVKFNL